MQPLILLFKLYGFSAYVALVIKDSYFSTGWHQGKFQNTLTIQQHVCCGKTSSVDISGSLTSIIHEELNLSA